MAEEKQAVKEEKEEIAEAGKLEEKKQGEAAKEKNEEKKKEEKIEKGKTEEKPKKEFATVNVKDLHISAKHSKAIFKMIKGKRIEQAILMLEDVVKMKRAVPMRGEIPHRKGMFSGRYPVKASEQIIKLLKSLAKNASFLGLEVENLIVEGKIALGAKGITGKGKRTHISLIAKLREKQGREK